MKRRTFESRIREMARVIEVEYRFEVQCVEALKAAGVHQSHRTGRAKRLKRLTRAADAMRAAVRALTEQVKP